MAIGKKLSCEIIDLANDGRGIGRVNGKAYFVEGALPGEEVEFSAVKEKRNFGEGRISKALIQSDYRRDPKCKYFSRCGGCSLQHLDHNKKSTVTIKLSPCRFLSIENFGSPHWVRLEI